MASPFCPDRDIKRHDQIFISPAAWRAVLEKREDLARDSLVASWCEKGWPVVARRALPDEGSGIPLGLPLPPFAGKRRLSFVSNADDIIATAPPPLLRDGLNTAPPSWHDTVVRVDALASRYDATARVFGSLAWQVLTGLDYLSVNSDLDLIFYVGRDTDLLGLTSGLASLEVHAPMRLDGELIRDDGAAVNWRELHAGNKEILIKSLGGVRLLDVRHFLTAEVVE